MAAPLHGQVAVTASAQALSATPVRSIAYTIKALSSNNNPVYIGNSGVTTANGFILNPSDTLDYELASQNGANAFPLNVSDYWVVGSTGDKVSWIATPPVS